MKRTKLADRVLPRYTAAEETANMVTHIIGGAMGIVILIACIAKTIGTGDLPGLISGIIYSVSMIALYTMSSVYHGLKPGMGKKVMQVIDHCTIYFLIAGSYTPILVCSMAPRFPLEGWGLLAIVWSLAVLACVFTAIDLHNYRVFSMICYIGMGWCIILVLPQLMQVMPVYSFRLLLAGGIAYTLGAILYGLGRTVKWMHSVFHIFVVLGSLLQFLCIYQAVL